VIPMESQHVSAGSFTVWNVPNNESAVLVPLRSNAATLLSGAPVASVRRRLKFASLFYERIYLEAGVFRMQAGPGGFFSAFEPPSERDHPRWQTPGSRHAEEAASFAISVGRERVRGVLAERVHPVVSSPTSKSWVATLHPFVDEFSPVIDWIEFAMTSDPAGEAKQLAQGWSREDEYCAALERAIPERFVRSAVIRNANRDLAIVAASGLSVSFDSLHVQVAAQRFRDDVSWKLHGYAVPIIFPQVGNLPWEAIAELRRDRHMARFRAELKEVENEAIVEAADGDIEAAAHHAYERHLANAPDALERIGMVVHRTLTGFVIGGITGFATSGIIGPLGTVAGAALGAVPTTVIDVRDVLRQRRSRGWIGLHQQIDALRD
jgi:hypothetical protein